MLLMAGYVQHADEECISILLMNDLSIEKIAYFHWEILQKKTKEWEKREKRSLLASSTSQEEFTSFVLYFLTAGISFLGEKKITSIILMNENPVLPCRLVCVKLLFFSHLIKASFLQWEYWTKTPPWT